MSLDLVLSAACAQMSLCEMERYRESKVPHTRQVIVSTQGLETKGNGDGAGFFSWEDSAAHLINSGERASVAKVSIGPITTF